MNITKSEEMLAQEIAQKALTIAKYEEALQELKQENEQLKQQASGE